MQVNWVMNDIKAVSILLLYGISVGIIKFIYCNTGVLHKAWMAAVSVNQLDQNSKEDIPAQLEINSAIWAPETISGRPNNEHWSTQNKLQSE